MLALFLILFTVTIISLIVINKQQTKKMLSQLIDQNTDLVNRILEKENNKKSY